jgi:hypothetical protein
MGDTFPGHRRDCGSGIAPPQAAELLPLKFDPRRGFEPVPEDWRLETVKGVTLGQDLDKRDLKRPTAGGTVTAGVPPQASRGGARSGQTPQASDSKLARRVLRSEALPRDP